MTQPKDKLNNELMKILEKYFYPPNIEGILGKHCPICGNPLEIKKWKEQRKKLHSQILALMDKELNKNRKEALTFEKVKIEDNKKIIFDFDKIASTYTGAEVFQSKNKNTITISYQGYYYHISLENIVNSVLAKAQEGK